MPQKITAANGDSVEVPDMRDLNRFLMKAVGVLLFAGSGAVWIVAVSASEVTHNVKDLDRRVTAVEQFQPELRELSRQMDSLRITLRESITEIRALRR